jgi:hypothetical protein
MAWRKVALSSTMPAQLVAMTVPHHLSFNPLWRGAVRARAASLLQAANPVLLVIAKLSDLCHRLRRFRIFAGFGWRSASPVVGA